MINETNISKINRKLLKYFKMSTEKKNNSLLVCFYVQKCQWFVCLFKPLSFNLKQM